MYYQDPYLQIFSLTHLNVKAAGLVGVWPPAHPAVAAAELVHHELVILTPGAHPATLLTLAHFLQSLMIMMVIINSDDVSP